MSTNDTTTTSSQHRQQINITCYNVHSCVGIDGRYSPHRIAQTVAYTQPDILCLQEIEANHPHELQTRIWSHRHNDHQPKEIASYLHLPYVSFAPAIRSVVHSSRKEVHDGGLQGGQFGNAILSKYPIVEERTRRYRRYCRKTLRIVQACLIGIPNNDNSDDGSDDVKIWIVNTHLGCHSGEEQYQQALELVEFIESLPKGHDVVGTVLCGDLNSLPFFKSVKVIESIGMMDAWKHYGQGYGATFPSAGIPGLGWCAPCCPPLTRLDYMFLKGRFGRMLVERIWVLKGKDGEFVDVKASDHLPLCMTLSVG